MLTKICRTKREKNKQTKNKQKQNKTNQKKKKRKKERGRGLESVRTESNGGPSLQKTLGGCAVIDN